MSLNRVMLMGNLGADPELRYTQSQAPVCTMRIATTERRKGQDGQWTDYTDWHTVVAWGKTAENCSQYLQKGRQIFVEGRLQTRKWQDQTGNNRYTTEVVASNVQFIGGRGGEGKPAAGENGAASYDAPPSDSLPPAAPVPFDDDDIPF